ncbi:MAG: FHA domain-containing protein [Planctomycetota bacterium]
MTTNTYSSTHDTLRYERLVSPSAGAATYGTLEASLELPCWLRDDPGPSLKAPRLAYQLVVLCEGEPIGRQVFVREELSIGRAPDCGLHLDHEAVSRIHARIAGGVLIDEGSTNGTWVNGQRVSRWTLGDGDVVRVACYELVYQLAEGAVPAAPAPPSRQPPEPGSAGHVALGETLRLGGRIASSQAERSVNLRGYLQTTGAVGRLQRRACQLVVERDTFMIGSDPGCDLVLQGWWIPRVLATIVRGPAGFTLVPLPRWPAGVRLNGHRLDRTTPLEDHDVLSLAGEVLTFRLGAPTATPS